LLDTIHTICAVDEQNKDEDERNFQPILNLGDYRILRDEATGTCELAFLRNDKHVRRGSVREDLPLDGEGKWSDQ
jgi:hypothetical protein